MTKKPSSKKAVKRKSAAVVRGKIPDMRALQALIADLAGGNDETPLERAQDIAWTAWDAPDRRTRI